LEPNPAVALLAIQTDTANEATDAVSKIIRKHRKSACSHSSHVIVLFGLQLRLPQQNLVAL
jgi:hypothetical protein